MSNRADRKSPSFWWSWRYEPEVGLLLVMATQGWGALLATGFMGVRIEENVWKVISVTRMAMDNTCHVWRRLKDDDDCCMAMLDHALGWRVDGLAATRRDGELMV